MLYIYRASAGSGKTFLLTGFYIELLFRNELTPSLEGRQMLFSEILAVTFTNKATAEMKERIIKELNQLWNEPRLSAYYQKITKPDQQGHVLSDDEIKRRAHHILTSMLEDYSNLHISTIDSFFQQVVRSFARELNVQGNYEIALDAELVLDNAVSQFLLNLDRQRDPETYQWILQFSNNRLQNGDHWNIHKELFKMAKVIITEDYRKISEEIHQIDRPTLSQYIERIDQIKREWLLTLKHIGKECCLWLQRNNLQPEQFSGNSKSQAKVFAQWEAGEVHFTKTLCGWAEDPTKWFKAKDPLHKQISDTDKTELQNLLLQAVTHMTGESIRLYNSAKAIRQNIYQLGILSQIEHEADEYCADQGIKLISNTTQMLNALVADETAPFIYEKTGTRIQSFMIDEFQDTSGMQWQNFSPLLRDSLGYGNRNLIVGDVKQSIYRWRGSDWELLHSKLNSFLPDMQAYDENGNRLSDNWRSDRKIVEFNNAFFSYASKRFHDCEPDNDSLLEIEKIYADVKQSFKAHSDAYSKKTGEPLPEGEVALETLEFDSKQEKYEDAVQRRLPLLVIALQQRGYKPSDILILCRKRNQCHLCAQALIDYKQSHPASPYGMDIITQEALLLSRQPVILALIAALELLHEPQSDYRRGVACICWYMLSTDNVAKAFATHFAHPDQLQFDQLLNLPLYETVERLIAMLPERAKAQAGFLNAFRDKVLAFCNEEGPNLQSFLHWWHDNGKKCSVSTPTDQNAIQIMTIHQSKGLDGNAVIVPFAVDSLDFEFKDSNTIWCQPSEAPFELPHLVLPIVPKAELMESIFSEDFNAERNRCIIDNLNTAYVAFTRARHTLIMLTKKSNKPNNGLSSFLCDFFDSNEWRDRNDKITTLQPIDEDNASADAENIDESVNTSTEPIGFAIPDINLPLIKQTDYIPPSDSPAARGTTLHAAFAAIHDCNDVDAPIRQLFGSGRAELQGCSMQEVLDYVHQAILNPEVQDWFAPDNIALNEQDIITQTTHTQRPDRIVLRPDGRCIIIDYKTGNERPLRHKKQVLHYVDLMKSMGFAQVEGYLWYIESGEIIKV